MKIYLVGNTGFVGSNLERQYQFDGLFSSKNIKEAYGGHPDLLIYSGVPAQKYLANKEPSKDEEIIRNAIDNIKKICPKKIVLISTIDVYANPIDIDESSQSFEQEEAYGRNRRILEKWVEDNVPDYTIVRLPALYGYNIKKNFVYDLIHIIPSMLKKEKYQELAEQNSKISSYYEEAESGFYKCKVLNTMEKKELIKILEALNFTALNFTDSRAKFQFYNLKNLWKDIQIALQNNLKVVNLATEPVQVSKLFQVVTGKEFKNEIGITFPNYNYKTKYCDLFGGIDGYIFSKEEVLQDLKKFIKKESR